MNKNTKTVLLLLLAVVIIAVAPLILIQDSEFGGADGMAEEVVAEISPDYEPWAESLIEPPGGETESLLFSLQSAIGAGIIGFGFGYLVCRNKQKSDSHTPK